MASEPKFRACSENSLMFDPRASEVFSGRADREIRTKVEEYIREWKKLGYQDHETFIGLLVKRERQIWIGKIDLHELKGEQVEPYLRFILPFYGKCPRTKLIIVVGSGPSLKGSFLETHSSLGLTIKPAPNHNSGAYNCSYNGSLLIGPYSVSQTSNVTTSSIASTDSEPPDGVMRKPFSWQERRTLLNVLSCKRSKAHTRSRGKSEEAVLNEVLEASRKQHEYEERKRVRDALIENDQLREAKLASLKHDSDSHADDEDVETAIRNSLEPCERRPVDFRAGDILRAISLSLHANGWPMIQPQPPCDPSSPEPEPPES